LLITRVKMEKLQQNQRPCIGDDLPSGTFVPYSRFTSVINFINNENRIVYITSKDDHLAANAIFIPDLNLSTVDSLEISSQSIILDNVSYSRKKMEIYDSTISFEDVDLAEFESCLLDIPMYYSSLFPEKSLVFLFNEESEKYFASGFDRQFMLNAKKSCELILAGEIIKGIENIRGTGYGLTPSGDDFIAGFLLGMHFNEIKFQNDLTVLRDKIFTAAYTGNALTASFLRNAKNRKYFRPLKKVLLLLFGINHSSLPDVLKDLLSVGATSGADFFSGYLFPIKHKTGI
jgi:hypothetical protein